MSSKRFKVKLSVLGIFGNLLIGWVATASNLHAAPDQTIFRGNGICQFATHNYRLTPQTEASINQEVVKLLKRHVEVFGFRPDPKFCIRIRIFGRFEDYQQFTLTNKIMASPSGTPVNITNLAGYYSPATREVVTWHQYRPTYLANNILHESSHAIMHGHFRRVPQWLLEGSGSYFSFPRLMQDRDDVSLLRDRWAKLAVWLKDKSLPSLPNFVSLDWTGWHRLPAERAITVSWSIFQFLMSTPQNQAVMRSLLQALQDRSVSDADGPQILNNLYPGGTHRLEQNWHNWILQNSRKILSTPDQKLFTR